ncbi:fimbria/pilus periplasmic chaperone [Burkholderia diffusa]|uniref:EcpB family pilus assembly chaperone n=1 Tax=Burkholderia diffusa TaxID=488732 RepID=UPI000841EDAB|nr:fimbria/pilus periplasmic chaperone [Burkholderia diffusa]AOI60896.1 hypothetical protein WI26_25525 [Burkholderia diffusa]
MKNLKILVLAVAAACVSPAGAIGIGSLTTEMQEKEFYVVKQIQNDDSVAKFVSTEVQQVSDPKTLKVLPAQRKDVLVSPATVFLPPHQKADVKIYYQGERDDKERYYQLSFIEQSVSSESQLKGGVSVSAKQRIRLSSILVVRPRAIRFTFEQDGKGNVRNTGNTFIHVTATGKCEEKGNQDPQACSRSAFLLPGETMDMSKRSGIRTLDGVGIWKGTDYQYFPAHTTPTRIVAK